MSYRGHCFFLTVDGTPVRGPGPLGLIQYIHEYNSFVSYSHRAVHLCPIFSQGKIYVSYSHRAVHLLWPILTGQNYVSYSHRVVHLCPFLTGQKICVLFSQGCSFVSYSQRAKKMCPILTGLFICVLFSQGKTNVKCVLILIYKNNKYLY